METASQIDAGCNWDKIADVVASTIGRGTPAHRAAVDVSLGFPDAYDRFLMFLEDEPDAIRDAIGALLGPVVQLVRTDRS